MKTKVLTAILVFLFTPATWAADITGEQLTGKLEFMYWADKSDMDNKHSVNMIMDFKSDGSITNFMNNSKTSASYDLQKDTIVYKDKNGQQKWKIITFAPGKFFPEP